MSAKAPALRPPPLRQTKSSNGAGLGSPPLVPVVAAAQRVSPAYPPQIPAMPPAPPPRAAPPRPPQPSAPAGRLPPQPVQAPSAAVAPSTAPVLQMPIAPTSATTIVEVHAEVASLWRRLLALLVDGMAISGVVALYLWAASSIAGAASSPVRLSGIDGWVARIEAVQPIIIPGLVLAALIGLAYSAAFAVLWNGRTFGRLLAGVRLVDRNGLPPSPTRAVVRSLLSMVSFGLFLGGFWLSLFDRRGQTLHDKLTSTFVVRGL